MASAGATVQDLLLDALEDLGQEEFEKLKFKLHTTAAPGCKNIPLGRLEKAKREELVELLVEFYEDKAVALIVTIFEDIGLKYNASKLSEVVGKQVQGYKTKYAETVLENYQLIEDRNSLLGESSHLNARYIDLLMIRDHRPQKQREHELTATGRRHMEILEENTSDYSSTTVESLFEPDVSGVTPRTVVLQGPAGIGKSMTVQKIMLDWAAGELYQGMFDYVFCIHCRELSLTEVAKSLADLILEQCQDMYAPVKEILAFPEKLLFIIDGFDELCFSLQLGDDHFCASPSSKTSMEDILSDLLRKKLLPKSYLLITTRPGATERLQRYVKFPRFAEILGFSEKGRREYLFKFFKDEGKANIALRFIENTTAVSTICFIPMVCCIICSVIKVELETEDEIADTLDTTTKVFVQFSHSLLKHHSKKRKNSLLDEFKNLCSLARVGILEQKILFEEDDLKEHNLAVSDVKDLFLDRRAFHRGIGHRNLYSFLHLCFQEFCAAMFYILSKEQMGAADNNEMDLKKLLYVCEKPGNEHLILTARFVFGLSSEKVRVFLERALQCKTSDLVKPLLLQRAEEVAAEDPPREGYCLLNFFHCLFESQEPEFARRVMHRFQAINISFQMLSVLDCRVLAFCLQHSTIQDHSIDLTFCRLKSHHMKALAPGIKNCTVLEFGSNRLGNSGANVLCTILKKLDCNVNTLNLGENYLTHACAQELCATLNTSHTLISLSLNDNSFTDSAVPFILHLMKTCTSLSILCLNGNGFDDKGRKHLKQQAKKIVSERPFWLWL
ncbi:NACHT, LRR and PYD domains-containing protein 3-like [Eublepharis macularius]|uniref:NACHT, LRR and PYD domains-containing protein 3-like n=1 Tax=Eublepharis macularius TaxID=481883 RepID=A0AA97JAT0_EUBMA|nr:NACHT, LRR and PYD domains-containing protein 3-like [Eublepharis macularius]